MPTYPYKCQACNHEYEIEQKITEPPKKTCPKCGKRKVQRQVAGGQGFALKGGGWAREGYSSK